MNRWLAFLVVLNCSIAISVESSLAGAVPAELYNKTVTLTWNIQMSVRNASGAVSTIVAPRERTVYISDKGRLFVRERRPDVAVGSPKSRKGHQTTQQITPEIHPRFVSRGSILLRLQVK
jgi:hypothetical protein